MGIMKAKAHLAARNQTLAERLGVVPSVADQVVNIANRGIRIKGRGVGEACDALENRIKRRCYGTNLRDRGIDRIACGLIAASGTDPGGGQATGDTLAASNRAGLREAAWNARQRSACLSPLQIPSVNERIVAIDLDIDVVFDGQRDGILHCKIQLSGSH